MSHIHREPQGSPYDFSLPITCPVCRIEMTDFVIEEFRKACKKHGTEFDLRKISDILDKYKD